MVELSVSVTSNRPFNLSCSSFARCWETHLKILKGQKIFINRKKLLNYACRKTNNIFSFDNPKKYVSTLNILAWLIQNLFCTTEIFLTRWPSEMVEKIVLNMMKFFRGGMQCISWDPFFYFRPEYMILIPYFRPDWLKCHTCTFLCHTYLTV